MAMRVWAGNVYQWAGPIMRVWAGPVSHSSVGRARISFLPECGWGSYLSRVWMGPVSQWAGPVMYVVMFGMWYLGELTKLCAYGFQFMFQVLLVPRGRARDDCIAHTTWFSLLGYYFD